MEKARIKTVAGESKVLRTMICISGALVVTLYKGPAIPMICSPPVHMKLHPHQHHNLNKDWIKGSILLSTSQIAHCTWIIFQEHVVQTSYGPISVFVCGHQEKPALITYPDVALN
ncbi:hypothetical protein KI387_007179, partial [Taxus chinensis]